MEMRKKFFRPLGISEKVIFFAAPKKQAGTPYLR
jgi:hypothetical protein